MTPVSIRSANLKESRLEAGKQNIKVTFGKKNGEFFYEKA